MHSYEKKVSVIAKSSGGKATKGANNKKKSKVCNLAPMMPRNYSAKEREEIRKREYMILRGG